MEFKKNIKRFTLYAISTILTLGILVLTVLGFISIGTKPGKGHGIFRKSLPISSQVDLSPPKGTPLFNMSRPHIGDVPYGQAIFSCANPGQVALTFDDGPYFWTSQIVDLLDDLNIKATFFVTGNNLDINRRIDQDQEYQYLLRRMRLNGHQIASHSWTHRHLEDIGREGRFQEMVYNEMALRTATGAPPSYMRPPYGEWRDADEMRDLGALGYHVVMYNLDTKDYKHDTEHDIDVSIGRFNDALREDGRGSYIVLAHDVHKWTALKLVPAMVNTLLSRGYKAVTVGECLNDDEFNWYRDPFDVEH